MRPRDPARPRDIAVMGPEDAIDKAADPAALRAEKIAEFQEKFINPYIAAERGPLTKSILPRKTRCKPIRRLGRPRTGVTGELRKGKARYVGGRV